MIRYITLKNYRCFENFHIDFTYKNDSPLKLAIIYGANGSGKSSLMTIFTTLYESMQTMNIQSAALRLLEEKQAVYREPSLRDFVNTTMLIKKNKTISSEGNMVIDIGFQIEGKNGSYIIEYDDKEIVSEKLEYTLEKNRGLYYSTEKTIIKINPKVFGSFKKELIDLFARYRGKHSVLSLLEYAHDNYTDSFFTSGVSSSLLSVMDYLRRISVYITDSSFAGGLIDNTDRLFPHELKTGDLDIQNEKILERSEHALNAFFTAVDSNIKRVYYRREYLQSSIHYTLLFERLISGKIKTIPYNNESSGIRNLIYLLPYFVDAKSNHIVAIDEIDNGIHDCLLYNLIQNLYDNINGQMIITTHNTLLMRDYKYKDSLFFMNVDETGNRTVVTPSESKYRIQADSNILQNYLKGAFTGLPNQNLELNFSDINL